MADNPMTTLRRGAVPVLAVALLLLGGVGGWTRYSAGRTAAAMPGVYVALGASDAVGVGAGRPAQEGWAPLVSAGLPAGTRFVNLGISGATLDDVLDRQVPVAVDASPRWITIWPGPNDLRNGVDLPTFAAQLDHLLDRLSQPGNSGDRNRRIVVLNLPDLRPVPAFARGNQDALDARVREWNAAIADAVRRHSPQAILVDLYARWPELAERAEYISADGFHPSSAGYRRIAELVLAEIGAHAAPSAP